MGITSSSLYLTKKSMGAVLLAPLHALSALLFSTPTVSTDQDVTHLPVSQPSQPPSQNKAFSKNKASALKGSSSEVTKKFCHNSSKTISSKRLKIVRELEGGIGPMCAGRMVISGRMADVCAELDRMTQCAASASQARQQRCL